MAGGLNTCPFRVPSDTCVTTDCELWNPTINQCGLALKYHVDEKNALVIAHLTSLIDTKNALVISDINTKFLEILTYLRAVVGTEAEAADLIPIDGHSDPIYASIPSVSINMLKHLNADHMDATASIGNVVANNLLMEYLGSDDLDGNGAIYLVNFVIDETDPTRPNRLFSTLESEVDINLLPYITWDAYKTWAKNPEGVTDPLPAAVTFFNTYELKLVQEFEENVDKDGNADIFFYTFKFDPLTNVPNRLIKLQEESTATKLVTWAHYKAWVDGVGPW